MGPPAQSPAPSQSPHSPYPSNPTSSAQQQPPPQQQQQQVSIAHPFESDLRKMSRNFEFRSHRTQLLNALDLTQTKLHFHTLN